MRKEERQRWQGGFKGFVLEDVEVGGEAWRRVCVGLVISVVFSQTSQAKYCFVVWSYVCVCVCVGGCFC